MSQVAAVSAKKVALVSTSKQQHFQLSSHDFWLSSYDTLIEALLLVMMFLTMSRCTELRKIITGVRFKHVDIRTRSGFRTKKVMTIEVVWFKNQQDRTLPKKVWMVTPCCGHSVKQCVCPFFAIMKLY